MTRSSLSATFASRCLLSSTSRLSRLISSFALLVSFSASSRPRTARLMAASASRFRSIASLLRELNRATLPCTSEIVRECDKPPRFGIDGAAPISWRGCFCWFARSADTGNRGVPDAGGALYAESIDSRAALSAGLCKGACCQKGWHKLLDGRGSIDLVSSEGRDRSRADLFTSAEVTCCNLTWHHRNTRPVRW